MEEHDTSKAGFARELSQQRALRERQWAAITNLLRVSALMPEVLPQLTLESAENFKVLASRIGALNLIDPAIDALASIESQKTLEDADQLTFAAAVVLAHSVFEDLLHSAADLSYRANSLWWKKVIVSNSKAKFSLRDFEQRDFSETLLSEGGAFLKQWKGQSLMNKVDSFFSVHPPLRSSYGEDLIFQRESLQALDNLRHKLVHENVLVATDREVVEHIYRSFNSGKFILHLLAEPEWIGFDVDALIKSASVMTGVSDERMNEVASKITPDTIKRAIESKCL